MWSPLLRYMDATHNSYTVSVLATIIKHRNTKRSNCNRMLGRRSFDGHVLRRNRINVFRGEFLGMFTVFFWHFAAMGYSDLQMMPNYTQSGLLNEDRMWKWLMGIDRQKTDWKSCDPTVGRNLKLWGFWWPSWSEMEWPGHWRWNNRIWRLHIYWYAWFFSFLVF